MREKQISLGSAKAGLSLICIDRSVRLRRTFTLTPAPLPPGEGNRASRAFASCLVLVQGPTVRLFRHALSELSGNVFHGVEVGNGDDDDVRRDARQSRNSGVQVELERPGLAGIAHDN